MAIALVVKGSAGSSDGVTSSVTLDTSGATLLVVCSTTFTTVPTVSDTNSNTWNHLSQSNSDTLITRISYAENPTVGSSHTFTISGGVYDVIHVLAFSGTALTSVFDQESGQASGANTSISPAASITPSSDGALLISSIGLWQFTTGLAINESYTPSDGDFVDVDGNNAAGAVAYLIQTSATASQPTWSWTTTAINVNRIASFLPGAGGGGGGGTVGWQNIMLLGVG